MAFCHTTSCATAKKASAAMLGVLSQAGMWTPQQSSGRLIAGLALRCCRTGLFQVGMCLVAQCLTTVQYLRRALPRSCTLVKTLCFQAHACLRSKSKSIAPCCSVADFRFSFDPGVCRVAGAPALCAQLVQNAAQRVHPVQAACYQAPTCLGPAGSAAVKHAEFLQDTARLASGAPGAVLSRGSPASAMVRNAQRSG